MAAWQTAFRALLTAALLAPPTLAQEALAQEAPAVPAQLVRMGTGGITGVYFPVGVALCRLANQHRQATGLRCSAQLTAGSAANLSGLRDGSLQFAIVQSDTLAQAVAGSGAFATAGPDAGLRALMSLFPEALTLVVRADAGVSRVEDLAGKRVALGEPGSGTRALAGALMSALGWTAASFAETPDIAPERLPQALCAGEIDGFLYVIGHPARIIQEATTDCDARLTPIAGAAVDELVESRPYYVTATIPGGLYRGNPAPVATFGVTAVLATEASVSEATVGVVAQAVVDNIDMLRGLDPVLAHLEPAEMTADLPAPLPPAAETIYRERGWLQ